MELDIYDFDKTIVPFESGSRFFIYCLCRYPWLIIHLPLVALSAILLALGAIKMEAFKRLFFGFVKLIPLKRAVSGFWDKNEHLVNSWFRERTRRCVVISASPDFLLGDIAKRLGFDYLICTRYDEKSLKVIGKNCRDGEKVSRLKSELPNVHIVDVYSDSIKHDKAIFSLAAGSCYNIVNGECILFDYNEKYGEK